ncbi:filamentous hemagglutinin N-terminal domain-containing protein, partial [Rhodanobacter ginsengisoli]
MSKSTHRHSSGKSARAPAVSIPSTTLPLRKTWPISLCVGLAIGSIVFSSDALAGGPTGGVVVGGSGSITQSGNQTIINQASKKLALDWQTFNVGANESVLFNQPSRSAVALNRILDQNPSQIFGRINSNGQIFLINTHGIIFGATAQVNVGGLLASTLDLTPKDFLAGNYSLNATAVGAGVVNHGLIQAASGGSVSLVGGSVLNDGLIFANYGSINLDGADHAVLDFDGNGLINIQITGELKQRLDAREAAVTNKGTLSAEDGTVVLQASAAKDLFTNLVNNAGVVDASGISTDGGVVRLVANGGDVASAGSIKVSGVHGGSAQLLSDQNVSVTGGIDASGDVGGGSIRIGGGYQGGEGLQRAAITYVGPDAILNADARQSGNGGSIVVWSDTATGFMGNIFARGGVSGGDGGSAEVSSHGYLEFNGNANLRADHGVWGTLLLDPNDVTISTSADSNSLFTGGVFSAPAPGAVSTINTTTLATQLNGNSAVNVTAGNNLTVANGFSYSGAASTLTLAASGTLTFSNGAIIASTSNTLSGVLSGTTGVIFNGTSAFDTHGGDLTITSGAGAQLGAITTNNLTVSAAGNITQVGVINAAGSSSFTVSGGSAHDITLNTQANQFNGQAVTVNATGVGSSIGTFSLEDTSNTALFPTLSALPTNLVLDYTVASMTLPATLTLGGNFGLTAGGGILLASDTTLSSSGGGLIDLVSAVNGAHALAVDTTGVTTFGGGVGNTTPLTNLTTDAGGSTVLNGNFTTSGAQTYNDAVTLGADSTLASTGNASINLGSTVDGAHALAVNTTGTTTFGGAVGGGAALTSLTTNAGGSTALNGNVTTSGAQTYNDVVTLGGDITLATTNSAVSFAGTVDNATATARALTVNAGAGAVTLTGAVGSSVINGALGALIVNSTGQTTFGSTVAAASMLTNAGGSTALNGNVTTSGTQTYNDALTLGSNITLATTNSAVSFGSTVDNATATARALTVNAGTGAVTFSGAVGSSVANGALGALIVNSSVGLTTFGSTVAAASLVTDAGGGTALYGNVSTSGAQTYNDAVTLGADATLASSGSGTIGFVSTLDGAHNLTVNTGGLASFAGAAGSGAALNQLSVTSGTFSANALTVGAGGLAVTTNGGGIAQGGAFTIAGTSSFDAGVNAITLTDAANTFTGAVSLTGGNVSLVNDAATVLDTSTVGGTLSVDSNGALTQTGALTVTNLATFTQNSASAGASQDIDLGTQFNDFKGGETFAGTINNLSLKNIDATPGTLTLPAGVAGNFTLNYTNAAVTLPVLGVGGALDVTASGGITINSNVTTGGSQAYHNAVLLGSDVTLATTNSAVSFGSTVDNATATARALTVNAGTGAVTFSGAVGSSVANGALGALIVNSTGQTTFGSTVAAASLVTDAGGGTALYGNVSTSGAQTYNDAVTLGADATLASSGSGTIGFVSTLDGAHNLTVNTGGLASFAGAAGSGAALNQLSVTSGTFSANALTVGAGGLAVTTNGGGIAQGGAFTVAGTSSFDAGANAITLTDAGNDFTGAVNLTGGATQITDTNALTLGTLSTGALTAISTGALNLGSGNVGGALSATSNNGAISQTGALTITGTSTLDAGTGVLTLANANNDFQGTVSATGDGVSLADVNDLSVTSLTDNANGNVSLIAGGALSLPASGIAAGSGNLSLAANGGVLSTGGALSGTNVSLTGRDGVTLGGNVSASGTLGLASTNAAITQTAGSIAATGLTTVNAGSGAITLTGAGNDFTGAVNLTGGATQITDTNALTLGTLSTGALTAISTGALNLGSGNVGGALSATSNNGAISQTGALTITGTSTLDAGTGVLTLANANNDFQGTVSA